jgi:hypothetical protein
MPQSTWTDEFLDQARQEGDPLADATVSAIFARGQVAAVNEAFGLLLRNDQLPLEQLPVELCQFLEAISPLPDWADPGFIRHAEQFFLSWGLLCLASLAAAGLPECYALADEARVLAITRRLTNQAPRRIIETAQLTVRVMDQGGLGPDGKGIRAAQKVRLLHATMRKLIRMDPPPEAATRPPRDHFEALAFFSWPAEFGRPISQEHLAYTLLTFSYVVPRSLERFGAPVTAQDWTAYLHCWNVVGHLLGLRRDLMAETKEDAAWLFARIKARHQADTPDGRALTDAVLAWMAGMLPCRCLNWVPPLVMWMLLDPPTAAILGVPPPSWPGRLLLAIYRVLPFVFEPNLILGRWMVSYLTALPRGWQRGLFDLPDSLQKPWRVKRKPPIQ